MADTWFRGPQFLWKEQRYWPEQPDVVVAEKDLELKKQQTVCTTKGTVEGTAFIMLLSRFSSWTRLQKSFAWLVRFQKCMLWRFGRKIGNICGIAAPTFHPMGLTVEELQDATSFRANAFLPTLHISQTVKPLKKVSDMVVRKATDHNYISFALV